MSDTGSILFARRLPSYVRDILSERADKVNKRANRHGFPTVTLSVTDVRYEDDPNWNHTDFCAAWSAARQVWECDHVAPQVEYATFVITATGPLAVNGWRLIGVIAADAIDQDGHAVPMVTNVPGETFSGTITDAQYCDHCQTRRWRTETFLVQHDDGTVRQIGRQCIRDFLGHDPASILAGFGWWSSIVPSDDEISGWGSSAPSMFTPDEILAAASRIVAKVGWYVSKAKAIESEDDPDNRTLVSTASQTWELLSPPRGKPEWYVKFLAEHPYNETAQRIHANTVEALATLNPRNEWEFKLAEYQNIARVGSRHVGIIASSVILGLRLEEKKVAAAAKPESNYVGKVGDRIKDFPATVTFMREFENEWGAKTLVKFESEAGDLAWWATSWLGDLKVGDQVTITGTVKSQDVDRYTKRPTTTLTRCKLGA